jgi:hypothetical protein
LSAQREAQTPSTEVSDRDAESGPGGGTRRGEESARQRANPDLRAQKRRELEKVKFLKVANLLLASDVMAFEPCLVQCVGLFLCGKPVIGESGLAP